MRKMTSVSLVGLVVLLLSLAVSAQALDVDLVAAPNVLSLRAPVVWLTLHAGIPYASVDSSSLTVTVNGAEVPVAWMKADCRAYLVVKVAKSELVAAGIQPGPATVSVAGLTKDGVAFAGTTTITVTR